MSNPVVNADGSGRIARGAILVLAYLHDTDASCSQVADDIPLSESSTYRWLTELDDADVLDAEAARRNGQAVLVYQLTDDELGAAAHVIADRLGGDAEP